MMVHDERCGILKINLWSNTRWRTALKFSTSLKFGILLRYVFANYAQEMKYTYHE